MNSVEKKEFTDVIKAMDEDDMKIAVMMFPDDVLLNEIIRRNRIQREMLTNVRSIVKAEDI